MLRMSTLALWSLMVALTDIPDVALDDLPMDHLIDVAYELDLHLLTAAILERQVLVANVAVFLELAERALARCLILKQPDLPELLVLQFTLRVAEKFGHEWIRVTDLACRGIENQDAVSRRLEETTVAKLGVPKAGFRLPPLRDVLDGEQDLLGGLAF